MLHNVIIVKGSITVKPHAINLIVHVLRHSARVSQLMKETLLLFNVATGERISTYTKCTKTRTFISQALCRGKNSLQTEQGRHISVKSDPDPSVCTCLQGSTVNQSRSSAQILGSDARHWLVWVGGGSQ